MQLGADRLSREIIVGVRQRLTRALLDHQSVRVFDRFAGKGVPEGKVSVAYRLVFQRTDRTLTEPEVSEAMERVLSMLARRFDAELRDAQQKGGGS